MKLFRATVMLPTFLVSLALCGLTTSAQIAQANAASERQRSLVPSVLNPHSVSQTSFVYARRQRIQTILVALDRVAAATLQMKPETAERIEPVVVDLAEQAVQLSGDDAITASSADASLDKLEETVSHLVSTLNRVVEPEMSL